MQVKFNSFKTRQKIQEIAEQKRIPHYIPNRILDINDLIEAANTLDVVIDDLIMVDYITTVTEPFSKSKEVK